MQHGVQSSARKNTLPHSAEDAHSSCSAPVRHLLATSDSKSVAFASSTTVLPVLMDSAAAAAAQEAPRPHDMPGSQRGRVRYGCALNLVLFLAVTASFAGAAYRARHRPRDLAFVAAAYYLLALLLCCVAKLELLHADPAAGDAQRRRARLATWAVSVALSVTFASRVADAMPLLPLKLAVWGVTAVFLGLGLYLFLCCNDADRRGAELRRGHEDSGSWPAKASRELSPEEMA